MQKPSPDFYNQEDDKQKQERNLGHFFRYLFQLFYFCRYYGFYNLPILLVNYLYIAWILFFLRYLRKLDYKRFTQSSANQSNLVQLVTGMQEIKLNNCKNNIKILLNLQKLTKEQLELVYNKFQLSQLQAEILNWELNYTLVAPIDGKNHFK